MIEKITGFVFNLLLFVLLFASTVVFAWVAFADGRESVMHIGAFILCALGIASCVILAVVFVETLTGK